MSAQEKAAWMLDTSEAAHETQCPSSLPIAEKISNTDNKYFATLRARLALLGRKLTRCHRAHDGRVLYVVVQWGESQYFNRLQDVSEHLTEIGRRP